MTGRPGGVAGAVTVMVTEPIEGLSRTHWVSPAAMRQTVRDLARDRGRPVSVFAADTQAGPLLCMTQLTGPQPQTAWDLSAIDEPIADLPARLQAARRANLRPAQIALLGASQPEARFSALMVANLPPLRWEFDLSAGDEDFARTNMRRAADGWWPATLAAYFDGTQSRYVSVWYRGK
jgi:hypothetical protein